MPCLSSTFWRPSRHPTPAQTHALWSVCLSSRPDSVSEQREKGVEWKETAGYLVYGGLRERNIRQQLQRETKRITKSMQLQINQSASYVTTRDFRRDLLALLGLCVFAPLCTGVDSAGTSVLLQRTIEDLDEIGLPLALLAAQRATALQCTHCFHFKILFGEQGHGRTK